ncbi:MAG: helix-turn-helix domain-containing protein [Bacteroidota bacterium]
MAKKRLSEKDVLAILQEVANGAKPTDLSKKHGFSLGSFYNWKNKYGLPGGATKTASAAPKAAPAAKASSPKPAPKKRGRKPGSKNKPKVAAARPATRTAPLSGAAAIVAKIKEHESAIEKLKLDYANAMLGL